MSQIPKVTATADKTEYRQGDPVVVTFAVDADTRDQATKRTVTFSGHDDEGNSVSATVTTTVITQVADTFTLDSVIWEDTGAAFAVNGLQAGGTA